MATHVMTTQTRHGFDHGTAGPSPLSAWLHAHYVRFDNWKAQRREFQRTVDELSRLSDRELDDIGIPRCDIRRIARDAVAARSLTP